MKKKNLKLKDKSIGDLEKDVQNLREEIAKIKLEFRVNPAKDTNILRKKRKQLAVTLTLISEKKEVERLQVK